jgi:DNA helicase-2/ATP-dependent DNA helicase PcrA
MKLDDLNEKQTEAVTTVGGPLMVLAGAGSGKTKVLTMRIAYLIKEVGILPNNILAITFTNKAANEMKERINKMLGNVSKTIQISTFHAFGLLLIKENYEKLGYKSNFTILDSDDQLTLIKKIMKELGYDPKVYNPKAVRNQISGAKNELLDSEHYSRFANTDFEEKVLKVYERYEERLKVNNSLDFDDLLMLPNILFRDKDILNKYQERYQYILVDEYQDTNQAQYKLINLLASKYKNICVVGDNDQSIYSWRQADYRNILNFDRDYKDTHIVLLEQNYRSTSNILDAANMVIKHNKERKEKNLYTDNGVGDKITYYRANDELDETFYVVDKVNELIKLGSEYKDIAILYRTNAQSRMLEETFLRYNIPYKVVGSFYFYNRKEIKDLISYLKLIYNFNDDSSLLRVINYPKRGIGDKSIEKLTNEAKKENKSLFETISDGKELGFKNMIISLKEKSNSLSLTELIDEVLKVSGIKKELESEKSIEAEIRLENLNEFKSITKSFEERIGIVSLEEFLNEISLVSDVEEHKNNDEVVTLMTVHSAKGLEFDNIIITGLEEGIFPHRNSLESLQDLEEERRLFYVAITRARKRVFLTNARRRLLFGQTQMNSPSRFILEIDDNLINKEHKEEVMFDKESLIDESAEYKVGEKIIHDIFGIGMIVSISGTILSIAFSHPHGIKQLMKGHKSITKVI